MTNYPTINDVPPERGRKEASKHTMDGQAQPSGGAAHTAQSVGVPLTLAPTTF